MELKTKLVPAVEKALSILEALAESNNGLTLSELTRKLGLPKSSTHSLLLTLERRGYLHRHEPTGHYLFGLKLLSLAKLSLAGIGLRKTAAPLLHDLMARTRLTVHLAVLEQGEAVLIEKIEPPGPFKVATHIGERVNVHCTAVGKALIASLPEAELNHLIAHGLIGFNESTIVSARKLKEELTQVRKLGYSVDDEERGIGLRCIGAPIVDPVGTVIAAISVSGSTAQITRENLLALAEHVKQTASDISRLCC
jgi:DNA-binding IclR family transcriptional regulator